MHAPLGQQLKEQLAERARRARGPNGRTARSDPRVQRGARAGQFFAARLTPHMAVAFDRSRDRLAGGARALTTGMPISAALAGLAELSGGEREVLRAGARRELGMPDGRRLVVFNGGSLGTVRLTVAAAGLAGAWQAREDVQLLIKTGPAVFADTAAGLSSSGGRRIARAVPYLDRMDLVYAAADLVVCRAGSATVPELAATGVPAVLVPYPYAPGDHQTHNARVLSDAGAGLLLADADATAGRLAELLAPLLADPARLAAMAGAADPGPARAGRRTAGLAGPAGRRFPLPLPHSPGARMTTHASAPTPTSMPTSVPVPGSGSGSGSAPTDWSGRTVLVTGAEGFIGSTLVDLLVARGAQVRAFVHYKPYAEKGHLARYLADPDGPVEMWAGDVRDAGRVSDAVAGCDTVFHLAALIGIPYSYASPGAYVQTNVTGTENMAEACRRHGVRRLVHTSTSEVYGTALTAPISESHPLQPQSPYSASKIGADMMALSFHHAFELPVTVVRPFNTYGPRQSARAVIPTILAQLHSGAREVRLGSLTPTRDFTYVTDTAAGFLAVAECDRALGEVVNLGTGEEISIGDLARALITASGRDAEVVVDPARLRPSGSEVQRLLSDNARARDWAGWKPEVSLQEGLTRTSEWIAAHLHLFAPDRYQV